MLWPLQHVSAFHSKLCLWGSDGLQENRGYWSNVPRVLKSLLEVRKITSTSIVLVEFGNFPFEHFAWGQALLYYNHVSTFAKDHILGKAWEAQLSMLAMGKKCWVGSMKKWLLHNQRYEVAGFPPPIQPPLETTLPVHSRRGLLNHCWEWFLGRCTYIWPV
jgi:hypothetical protein